jgi:hypothetical protein
MTNIIRAERTDGEDYPIKLSIRGAEPIVLTRTEIQGLVQAFETLWRRELDKLPRIKEFNHD